jgi:hypothetical protein
MKISEKVWQVVEMAVGQTIHQIHRVLYMFEGQIDWNDGALQLTFTDRSVLRLDGASDGDTLQASGSPWADPFSGKLTAENKNFIRMHGKWALVDVSDMPPYDSLIGEKINKVHPIFNQFGTLCGVQVLVKEQCFNFVVEADECHLLWKKACVRKPVNMPKLQQP